MSPLDLNAKCAWLSDIHLDFVDEAGFMQLIENLRAAEVKYIALTGDISTAPRVANDLERMASQLDVEIFFVLGNHDFYGGSIAGVRKEIAALCDREPRLHWLSREKCIEICPEFVIIGHDGWYDGRYGDYINSTMSLTDFTKIEELSGIDRSERLKRLHALGNEAAAHVRSALDYALAHYPELRQVTLLTHVPPFADACLFGGQPTGADALPFFACEAVGDLLTEYVKQERIQIVVLCGHTHFAAEASFGRKLVPRSTWTCCHRPSLFNYYGMVYVAGAEYGKPAIQFVDNLEDALARNYM